MKSVWFQSDYELTKGTPHVALTGKPWSVFSEKNDCNKQVEADRQFRRICNAAWQSAYTIFLVRATYDA